MLHSICRFVMVWAVCLQLPTTAPAAEPLFKDVFERDFANIALPGVYRVYSFGSGQTTVPESVVIRFDLLDSDVSSATSSEANAEKRSRTERQWRMIATNPDRYLTAAGQAKALPLKSELYMTGSAFAVSREGILLTNRHVVYDIEGQPLEAETVASLNPDCHSHLLRDLQNRLGKWDGDPALGLEIRARLCEWIGAHCRQQTTFEKAFVGLAFAMQPDVARDPALTAIRLFDPDAEQREPVLAPVTVMTRGGSELSDDVAILRIDSNVQDALICLPLADEKQIKWGDKVCSLGYPGHRYEDPDLTPYRYHAVNVEPGRVEMVPFTKPPQHLQMRMLMREKGLTAELDPFLVISAEIRHGSSGGPVVLENGSVAGLNVAFAMLGSNRGVQPASPAAGRLFANSIKPATSVDIAVPISVARKKLSEIGIVPDTGPTTDLWRKALQEYRAGNFGSAEERFRDVARRQVMRPKANKPYEAPAGRPVSIVHSQVQAMIDACRQSAK